MFYNVGTQVFYCSQSIKTVKVSWNRGKNNEGGVTGIQVIGAASFIRVSSCWVSKHP